MSGVGASKAAVRGVVPVVPTKGTRTHAASSSVERPTGSTGVAGIVGVHHVGMICKDLEKSVVFYRDVLGLPTKMDRPDDKLPFRGAWFWIGTESIHLMEVPNPDPTDLSLRPEHGGRDRHFCMGVEDVDALEDALRENGVQYTKSKSGRAAIFFRDPDANTLECLEVSGTGPWREY
ncbi:glyoxalase [Chloropicon primus]|uniref:Glyoxalase n=1 Tax=Chloropicon primus TaxID=1764295 RepID=A0A5B8MK76_9CHLO|nr:glyoxalase [Chloropicon primus]UPR00060.1 glyoxalase [Chloropicon primus]|eukprot:QDZ20847.1 glyoxalase [Chloropicon primus]